MIGRRRPLLRAAAVGGGAYYAGKRHAENQASEQAYRDDQQAQIDELRAQQAYAAQPQQAAPAGGLGDDAIAELEKLGKLKEQGILTQEEFDAQKARILGSA
jgi:hypothetical protein